ncbi:hypothetical protein N865_04150 [Intrasporangium oryzae NRRL B-24470]|uniref:Uncharacterized protein n=1 Tax=Intrasporangium oryzae NRRL B-24470 TaxID=1386089 RepID=W9GD39_9MICO|nr:hypothetical protein [Intrasporangium oryzae]EWT02743.1 hypothetical protein N865_04150 [Intrasporangium oryzae NRRL B-24470]
MTQLGASGMTVQLLGLHPTIAESATEPGSSLPPFVALLIAVALAVMLVVTAFALLFTLAALVMAVAAIFVALRAAAAVALVVTAVGTITAVAGALVAVVCVVVPLGLCVAAAVALTVRATSRRHQAQAVADSPPLELTAALAPERPAARVPGSTSSRIAGAA